MVDYLLALPAQLGKRSGFKIAEVLENILARFGVTKQKMGWFITDNAPNNDTAMEHLSKVFSFDKSYKRCRCAAHIINLCAQAILFGKEAKAFENEKENQKVSLECSSIAFQSY